jgi:hypothetical protein
MARRPLMEATFGMAHRIRTTRRTPGSTEGPTPAQTVANPARPTARTAAAAQTGAGARARRPAPGGSSAVRPDTTTAPPTARSKCWAAAWSRCPPGAATTPSMSAGGGCPGTSPRGWRVSTSIGPPAPTVPSPSATRRRSRARRTTWTPARPARPTTTWHGRSWVEWRARTRTSPRSRPALRTTSQSRWAPAPTEPMRSPRSCRPI